jgi:uncharacterized membrane protein YadS
VRFFTHPLLRVAISWASAGFNKLARPGPGARGGPLVVFLGAAFVAWLGGRLGVRRSLALLLGTGTSVCGASAIAAAGPLVHADEDDVAVSIGLVSILGTIGVVTYPALARLAGLGDTAYGLLCGASLHEVPQVLAAAFARGQAAGDLGTLVKLTRVALLAPLALGLAAIEARHRGEKISLEHLPIPWFVVGFVAVGALRSLGVLPASWVPWLEQASRLLLVAAMAAVGLGVHIDAVRRPAGRRSRWRCRLAVRDLTVASAGAPDCCVPSYSRRKRIRHLPSISQLLRGPFVRHSAGRVRQMQR